MSANTASSIITGNDISHCVVENTGAEGIYMVFTFAGAECKGNVIRSCVVRNATRRGIYVGNADYCRIEGNHISEIVLESGIRTGLFVGGSDNLVIRNSCNGASDNINIGAANTFGPDVNATGALSSTGNESHPMANYNMH